MSWKYKLSHLTALKCLSALSVHTFCAQPSAGSQPAVNQSHQMPRQKFVIIGLGTAGTSAIREILKHGKATDSIMIVDPHAQLKLQYSGLPLDSRMSLAETSVTDIDHVNRIVRLSNGAKVSFDKCLIAVGSASPALNAMYVDSDCDVAQTVVDLTHLNAPYELYKTITESNTSSSSEVEPPGNVALLGANCWETVHLAGKLAAAANHHQAELADGKSSTGRRSRQAPVTLIYPGYGPMSHSLPRYLSLALSRRLASAGVNMVPYTHVRYLGADAVSDQQAPSVLLYTAKTYDSLSTQSVKFRKIAFAPTAVPTAVDAKEYYTALREARNTADEDDGSTQSRGSANGAGSAATTNATLRCAHIHDFILRSGLELDRQSGGIAVNQSLQACDGVYAAGDIASVYSGHNRTSYIDLIGTDSAKQNAYAANSDNYMYKAVQQRGTVRGYANAAYSGMVAGRNMVCSTHSSSEENAPKPLVYAHTPVYHASSEDIGVHFTFIGNCSSALESHGFWWRLVENNNNTAATAITGQVATQLSTQKSPKPNSASREDALKPPLGLGVVFYIAEGTVAGVLVSGLPPAVPVSDPADVNAHNFEGSAPKHRTYSDHVLDIGRGLIGKSVQELSAYTYAVGKQHIATANGHGNGHGNDKNTGGNSSKDNGMLYELDVAADAEAEPADHKSDTGTDTAAADMGDTAVLLQALSLEARRVISPVLSSHLYVIASTAAAPQTSNIKTAPATTKGTAQHVVTITAPASASPPQEQQLRAALQGYPRPLYRYGSASSTTLKDLSECVARSTVRPVQLREALFQPENVNTGSKVDNLYAAYKKKLVNGGGN